MLVTSKPKFSNTCDGCCVSGGKCDCGKCYPRMLCATATYECDAYGDAPSCCSAKTAIPCSGVGSWAGPVSCPDGTGSVNLEIQIMKDESGTCFTRVTCVGALEGSINDFAGVLPTMTVDTIVPDGTVASITITRTAVIANPLLKQTCSPCVNKAPCLPEQFCFEVVCPSSTLGDIYFSTLAFNCSSWTGPAITCGTDSYSCTITLLSDGRCGVTVTIEGGDDYPIEDVILFSSPDDPFFTMSYSIGLATATLRSIECGECPKLCCCLCQCVQFPKTVYATIAIARYPHIYGADCSEIDYVLTIECNNPDTASAGIPPNQYRGLQYSPFNVGCDSSLLSPTDYYARFYSTLSCPGNVAQDHSFGDLNIGIACYNKDGSGTPTSITTLYFKDASVYDCSGPVIEWVITDPSVVAALAGYTVGPECGPLSATVTVTG